LQSYVDLCEKNVSKQTQKMFLRLATNHCTSLSETDRFYLDLS
jgi:hypothetical protein